MVLAGRWEVSNQVIDGRDIHIGERGYDAMLKADLEQAVAIASSTGAYVMLLDHPVRGLGRAAQRPALGRRTRPPGASSTTGSSTGGRSPSEERGGVRLRRPGLPGR